MTQLGYLIGCIEGSAVEFVPRLPPKTRYNFIELVDALNAMSLHEYAARVADVVTKA